MSLQDIAAAGAAPVGWAEPWWLAPQLRMVVGGQLESPERADGGGEDDDGQGPAELADCYARQLDELAALVESALREEVDAHRALAELVQVRHQRRMTSLRVLAESLGEAHTRLDELAHRLRATLRGSGS